MHKDNLIPNNDENIKEISLFKYKHPILYAYVGPFLLIYLLFAYLWLYKFGIKDNFEMGMIVYAFLLFLNLITFLICIWSVYIRSLLLCIKVFSIHEAHYVRVTPTPNNGSCELVKIHKKEDKIWFNFQKIKYIYNSERKQFTTISYPVNEVYNFYLNSKGLTDDSSVQQIQDTYGLNEMNMEIPEFMELMQERATAPFFVFQVLCVGLWCLYDQFYYSLFTLVMLVVFEATLVKQQLRNMSEIRKMGNKSVMINVYRNRKWRLISSENLLPGDICSITRNKIIPCDLLLLHGSCIVDESMLTGESIPQAKEPIENEVDLDDMVLDVGEDQGKLHVLCGGTRVVQHTPPTKAVSSLRAPDHGCSAYVLRTGFSTSQGKLLRTILFGVKRVTADNKETFLFILLLLCFAIAAASYVWIKGSEDTTRSRYKLLLECILIITSVVPPELPIELSLAVNTSLVALSKLGIFCTEPFRIPYAGKIDICCFDKTGTLTTDDLIVEGMAGLPPNEDHQAEHELDDTTTRASNKEKSGENRKRSNAVCGRDLVPLTECPSQTKQVLACCNSLTNLDEGVIGDPLEKITLKAVGWNLTKNDVVIPAKGKDYAIKIFHRFHFTSSLKRMSVVAGFTPSGSSEVSYFYAVKGAPEVLKPMFTSVPETYDSTYLRYAHQGARVLAIGRGTFKPCHGLSDASKLRDLVRQDTETDLTFQGFLIISCPLKNDSASAINEIKRAQHQVVMITGDNPLTACHVARELRMVSKDILILQTPSQEHDEGNDDGEASTVDRLVWKSVDGSLTETLEVMTPKKSSQRSSEFGKRTSFFNKYDLCLTGEGFNFLTSHLFPLGVRCRHSLYDAIISRARVYARFTPKQKEAVVTSLNRLGFVTLMCGDGTNDVGALKHANVGVSIVSSSNCPQFLALEKAAKAKKNDLSPAPIANSPDHKNDPTTHSASKPSGTDKKHKEINSKVLPTPGLQTAQAKKAEAKKKLHNMLEELETEMNENPVVKLGDASIAAPFTSKLSSIQCVCHIIKQGRCTLVTTLQMFKILALNALILAYSQSVLYLEGVKFSDTQSTIQGILLAVCFLFISRAKPLNVLSRQRPLPNVFNVCTLVSLFGQFGVHFYCLVTLFNTAVDLSPPRETTFVNLESDFKASLVNSTVYVISLTLQVATFAINYHGKPFMESLLENRQLLYSLIAPIACAVSLTLNLFPDFTKYMEIVEFPPEFKYVVIRILALDIVASYAINFLVHRLLISRDGYKHHKSYLLST